MESLSLFGSYARGEANENSDIDFYFDKGDVKSLFQHASVINKLEEASNCPVDLVSTGINNREFLEKIRKNGVLLYKKDKSD